MSSYPILASQAANTSDAVPVQPADRAAPKWLWREGLWHPVSGFLQRDGKRIRAELVELAFNLAGGEGDVPAQLVEFIELMHAGSLIIDDIEDDSESRRGQPSLHRTVGMPIALNTGNWMYFSALEKLTCLPIPTERLSQILSDSITTIRRCHEGQAIDLAAKVHELQQSEVLPTVKTISQLKTGGLTALAAQMGAAVAGANACTCEVFANFGMQLGIGLQMQNDLTELQNCQTPGGRSDDLRNRRVTWPWAWLSTFAAPQEFCRSQQLLAEEAVADEQVANLLLATISNVGVVAVGRQLREAAAVLEKEQFESASMDAVHTIVNRLENRYA